MARRDLSLRSRADRGCIQAVDATLQVEKLCNLTREARTVSSGGGELASYVPPGSEALLEVGWREKMKAKIINGMEKQKQTNKQKQ